jgi:hypothetical protein
LQVDARHSTAYHPQTDGLTERTNQTLETYLRAYVSYQQDDWVDYLPLAEFSFNSLENSSTKVAPFYANLGFHPTFEPQITERSTVPAAENLARSLEQIHTELRAELEFAQSMQAHYYDKHRLPAPEYQRDQLVWLLRRNIKTTRPSGKLDHQRLGPYPIIRKIGSLAYQLALPSYLSRLHPVFNVSLLEPYSDPSQFHPHANPEPFQLSDENFNDLALHIHSILDCRKIGHRYEYFVRWKNLSEDENSWIPLSDIPTSSNELIDRFHRRHPKAPRPHSLIINATPPHTLDPPNFNLIDNSTFISDPLPPASEHTSVAAPPSFVPVPAPAAAAPLPLVPSASSVPPASARPASPPVIRQNLRSEYVPPLQTTTRSGRVSKPRRPPDVEPSKGG